jgi:transposase
MQRPEPAAPGAPENRQRMISFLERPSAVRRSTSSVRVPHERKPGGRRQEVRTYPTTTPALLGLRDWLICQGVTRVVMEATSAYWKPPFYLLEDDIECWVVNARDVKNVPGRPKTDKIDSVWLCKLAERGMLRASFIPGRPQRQLRDLR